MPRTARLDAPGVLHHVMIRGIEGKKIFRNNKDRDDFIERLETLYPQMQITCYAWAFMSNHAHFIFRTGQKPLSTLMRRLLTGYVISFNKRHRRQGQLFQNRYKSIVCQEDTYLLELVRYIHLNPIRAGKEPPMLPGVEGVRYSPYSVGKKTGIKQREYKCFR
jgi:REP element-mobilizing transposase RayT